eukprot:564144-Prymnesium_polylepis.1
MAVPRNRCRSGVLSDLALRSRSRALRLGVEVSGFPTVRAAQCQWLPTNGTASQGVCRLARCRMALSKS